MRSITVYLPPGYENSTQHYPVIYFLHGFMLSDTLMVLFTQFNHLLDDAISTGRIRPVIVVFPNSDTRYKGSFYTNSSLTGNWADYIAEDVINYVDQNFRTIPKRDSRGLAGHSMGGHGALKLAMFYPDKFSAIYAMSPALLGMDFEKDTVWNQAFRTISMIKNPTDVFKALHERMGSPEWVRDFGTLLNVDLGRIYSPDESNLPFQADFPITFEGDKMIKHPDIIKKWEEQCPINMLDNHIDALKRYVAIKIDWGKEDENKDIPVMSKQFSEKLENAGIKNVAEEYEGTHISKIGGPEGRIAMELLPFFNSYLKFEDDDTGK